MVARLFGILALAAPLAGCVTGDATPRPFSTRWSDDVYRTWEQTEREEKDHPWIARLRPVIDRIEASKESTRLAFGKDSNLKLKVRFRSWAPAPQIEYKRTWGEPQLPMPEPPSYKKLDRVLAERRAREQAPGLVPASAAASPKIAVPAVQASGPAMPVDRDL